MKTFQTTIVCWYLLEVLAHVYNITFHFGQAQKIVAILLDPEFKSVHNKRSQRSVYVVNVLNSDQNVLH